MQLKNKHCKPCEGAVMPLSDQEEDSLLDQVDSWDLYRSGSHRIQKQFVLNGFKKAIEFVEKVAQVAELEDHHPDIHIHYNKVVLQMTTHAINGLSENDFIVASKIDTISV